MWMIIRSVNNDLVQHATFNYNWTIGQNVDFGPSIGIKSSTIRSYEDNVGSKHLFTNLGYFKIFGIDSRRIERL